MAKTKAKAKAKPKPATKAKPVAKAKPATKAKPAANAKPVAKAKAKPGAKAKPAAKAKPVGDAVAIVRALRTHALAFPGAVEEFPWDHSVVKIAKKVIIFLDQDHQVGDEVRFSVKLPESAEMALNLPFATPTGYGLGRAGWVSFAFGPADAPPAEVLRAWIDESFCAVAPKRAIAAWRAGRG